jgi:WD40 repeat protein
VRLGGTRNGERGTGDPRAFLVPRLVSLILVLAVAGGCRGTLSPLSNRIKVGEEPFVVFVADGEEGAGDLFAVPAAGGTAFQVTFTRVDESQPALSPDGSVVAFARGGFRAGAPVSVALLNLANGAERRIDLPPGAAVQRIGWSPDGTEIFIRTTAGTLASAAPPAAPLLHAVAASDTVIADSALAVLLGDPAFAAAGPCATGQGLCALGSSSETLLDPEGRDPLRWSGDSVAFFVNNSLVVRPLGAGRVRRLTWTRVPAHAREASYTPGPAER